MLQSLFHTLSDLTSPTLITLALVILIVIAQASSHTTPSLIFVLRKFCLHSYLLVPHLGIETFLWTCPSPF